MKRIEKENTRKVAKMLKELEFVPTSKKAFIFFPIDAARSADFDGLEMNIKGTGTASRKELVPGIILVSEDDGDKAGTDLAYANIDYSPKFDMIQYKDIMGVKVSKNLENFLYEYEAYLVSQEYIAATFKL